MALPNKASFVVVLALVCFAALLPDSYGGEKIKVLVLGQLGLASSMEAIFSVEPSISYEVVVGEDGRLLDTQMQKLLRLYFPRTQKEMGQYDFIFLLHLAWHLFTAQQDAMIFNAIRNGAGAINDGSVFSIASPVPDAWAASLSQQAFPNDAPAVVRTSFEYATMSYQVKVNRDFPDSVLTSFVPYGVEDVVGMGATRMVIAREGAATLAWIIGPFPWRKNAELLVAWDYEKGRAMTSAEYIPTGWFGYPSGSGPNVNEYAPDILMNMIFYGARRNLIDDVVVFHRLKSSLTEFRARMGLLIKLSDFIDKFGANTQRIQDEVMKLEGMASEMVDYYLDQDFIESERVVLEALDSFPAVEEIARKEKGRALLWVYIIEWLGASSTFFISGFILWTLMVRRRLYRETRSTRLRAFDGGWGRGAQQKCHGVWSHLFCEMAVFIEVGYG
jgi:hypothetical protein